MRLMTPSASPNRQRACPSAWPAMSCSWMLLYRLLTGRLPYRIEDASPLEAARIIREEAPLLPSKAVDGSVAAELRDDLYIVRGPRKEPERRYGTVAAFADDITRYSAFKPVRAYRIASVIAQRSSLDGIARRWRSEWWDRRL